MIPKNTEEIINEFVPKESFFLGKRTDTPILPVTEKIKKISDQEMEELYGTRIPMQTFWEEKKASFYIDGESFRKALKPITELLFDHERLVKHIEKVVELCYEAKKEAEYFLKEITEEKEKKLYKQYKKTINNYARSFIHGFISWCLPVLQKEVEEIIKRHLKEIKLTEKEAFGIVASPTKDSDYQRKEKALAKLKEENIPAFLKKYGWLGYEYDGPETTYEEVLEMIKEKKTREQIPRSEIIKIFTEEEKEILESMSLLSFVKDERNSCDDYVHYCLDHFYTEIGRRHDMTKDEIKYLWPEELEKLIYNNEKPTKKYMEEKRKICAVSTKEYLAGKKAEEFKRKIFLIFEEEDKDEVKGITASPGKAKGRVRIIETYKDIKKVKKGDILVTHMTSQRYIPAIKKAKAIITEEGGLTCHAAIISREFKIPCIIGTKNATKILKDNDKIELDADKGVVIKC
jgi:phosphoenolpyruvate synthase/pyruvate phosphate dikinase